MITSKIAKHYTLIALQPALSFIEGKVLGATAKGHTSVVFDLDIEKVCGSYGAYVCLMKHIQETLGYSVRNIRKERNSCTREIGLFWG